MADPAHIARPGTVNYAEGSVTLAGKSIGAPQIGNAEAEPGQVLSTAQGKAEMLLTPGVLLRLGDNSAVRMVSPSLTDTRVELLRGEALVEAADVERENHIDIIVNGVDTLIQKHGLYRFNAATPQLAVFDGKARVMEDDHSVEVGKARDVSLDATAKPKVGYFNRKKTDDLYAWSKLRSGYLADASEATVQNIIVGGPDWYGLGWYWNPWFDSWAFVPGDGYLMDPFGFGFYSPNYWYGMGLGYGGYGYGYGYGGYGYGYRGTPYRYGAARGRAWHPPAVAGVGRGPAIRGGAPRFSAPMMRGPAMGGMRSMGAMGGMRSMGGMRAMGGGMRGGGRR
ncbi:MAG: FecR domain-containing protein [Acidobacteria bacterium]|nr:FecR domain-containing protein [Acidobacteriota bacterium]